MLIAPSLNSLFITGTILIIVFILLVTSYKQFLRLNNVNKINILLLLSIAMGIHGLVHLGVEQQYGFNPYNWV